jgi:hypothetical protein
VLAAFAQVREIASQGDGSVSGTMFQSRLDYGPKYLAALPRTARKEPVFGSPIALITPRGGKHTGHSAGSQRAKHPKSLAADSHENAVLGKRFAQSPKKRNELIKKQLAPPFRRQATRRKCLEPDE